MAEKVMIIQIQVVTVGQIRIKICERCSQDWFI